jgi:muconolactone delta-isomerase
MTEYLIEINLPGVFTPEFIELVPKQRELVNKMMMSGIITSYALSLESRKLWVTLMADSHNKVNEIMHEFPIFSYIDYQINELTFHNNVKLGLPQISLN